MFTGLIQALGTIQLVGEDQVRIATLGSSSLWQDLELGDSVAVDGICLTVTKIVPNGFVAIASPETLSRTTLGQLENPHVNLETSLRVGSKLGGHFVTGHIDGVGHLQSSTQTATSWEMSFEVTDARISRYIVPKGSIAINGVSLTVSDCNLTGTWFKVAVIPHTYAETNLHYLHPGSRVNLEGDVLGKYVEKFLRLGSSDSLSHEGAIAGFEEAVTAPGSSSVTASFLTKHGYF